MPSPIAPVPRSARISWIGTGPPSLPQRAERARGGARDSRGLSGQLGVWWPRYAGWVRRETQDSWGLSGQLGVWRPWYAGWIWWETRDSRGLSGSQDNLGSGGHAMQSGGVAGGSVLRNLTTPICRVGNHNMIHSRFGSSHSSSGSRHFGKATTPTADSDGALPVAHA